jgi:DNA polymerase III epsilon subunit-like protein
MPVIQNLLHEKLVIFDTETTGLHNDDVVIQFGAVSGIGRPLQDSLYRSEKNSHPRAIETHGIADESRMKAPRGRNLLGFLESLRRTGHSLIAYNASFDVRLIEQSIPTWQDEPMPLEFYTWLRSSECAMEMAAQYLGQKSRYIKLQKALELTGGYDWGNTQHTGIGDCLATLELLRRMQHGL